MTLKTALKIFISLAIVALIIARMDLRVLADLMHEVHMSAWICALSFMVMQILALSYRWAVLTNVHDRKISWGEALRITLASLLANFLLVASISGIFVRIALTMSHGVSLLKCGCAAIIDRVMTLLAIVLLAIVFMPALGRYFDEDLYHTAGFVVVAFTFLTLVFVPFFSQNLIRRFVLPHRKLAVSFNYMRTLLFHSRLTGRVVAVSLLAQLFYFAAIYFIARSLGLTYSFLDLLTVLPIITLIASLPVSVGGWGVREGAFVYGLGLIGVPMETAFMISVQIGLISMLSTFAAGIPVLLADSVRGKSSIFHRYRLATKRA